MCTVLHVSRSGYYEWIKRKENQRSQRRKELEMQVRRAFLASRRLYGSSKITQVLRQSSGVGENSGSSDERAGFKISYRQEVQGYDQL